MKTLNTLLLLTVMYNSFCSCNEQPATSKNVDSTVHTAIGDSSRISLFNGQTLVGWHTYGKPGPGSAWDIDSNSIHLKHAAKSGYQTAGGGDLITDSVYDNFDLQLEWKISSRANSGIMIYVQEDTAKYKETWNTGPEMQVCDKDSNEDAHSPKHEPGDLYDLIAANPHNAKGANEWNKVEIKSDHGKLDLFLNGVHIISTTLWNEDWKKLIAGSKFKDMPGFGTFTSGHIALQDHGDEVWYRNISIRKL